MRVKGPLAVGRIPSAPDLEPWLSGESAALQSPPLGEALRAHSLD